MRFLSLALFWALFPCLSRADSTLTSRLHHLDYGDHVHEPILIYLSSGQVIRMNSYSQLEDLQRGFESKQQFNFTINDENELVTLEKSLEQPVHLYPQLKNIKPMERENYTPSIISMEKAREFFYESMYNPKESQCYNRAHVWGHEWRIKHNLYSNKVWVFFTRKYIREFTFNWWFHVSPYVHVVEDGKVRERVLDVKYSRGPVKIKQWTDIFLRDDAACPLVEKYSDHANYPEFGSCFIMKSSMYYYQPVDLEWKEAFGVEKNSYIPSEIVASYLEAFEIDLQGNSL